MKVCPECGALYLEPLVGLECKACSTRQDNGETDYLGVWLRELTPDERKSLWHWLATYEKEGG